MKKLVCLVALLVASAQSSNAAELDNLPLLKDVAPEATQRSPHVPMMGEHWANDADLPDGPLYCVIEGRVACIEYILTGEDLQGGRDWLRLSPGFETPPITHIDIEHRPNGLPSRQEPLYMLHVYFVERGLLERH